MESGGCWSTSAQGYTQIASCKSLDEVASYVLTASIVTSSESKGK